METLINVGIILFFVGFLYLVTHLDTIVDYLRVNRAIRNKRLKTKRKLDKTYKRIAK